MIWKCNDVWNSSKLLPPQSCTWKIASLECKFIFHWPCSNYTREWRSDRNKCNKGLHSTNVRSTSRTIKVAMAAQKELSCDIKNASTLCQVFITQTFLHPGYKIAMRRRIVITSSLGNLSNTCWTFEAWTLAIFICKVDVKQCPRFWSC